ncbi:hypothetical protein BGP75_14165 [Motiliproteus sp. MSK22-1]|nr:hypothetical protein BGP75_14165 [Motiliproteus sp. MSK22-1]
MLHTVNKSPLTSSCLNNCLRAIGDNDGLLLIEDGVYGADKHQGLKLKPLPSGITVYALKADVEARGLMGRLSEDVRVIDDQEFVDLVVSHNASQSWY